MEGLCVRIGVIDVILRSECPETLQDFRELYRSEVIDEAEVRNPIRMIVRRRRSLWSGRTRLKIEADGRELGRSHLQTETLPYLEWGINWRVIAERGDFLQLHAATLVRHGRAVVFAGTSGVGKSTLAAALLARGWRYATDELTLIDPASGRVMPFPKAVCIKSGSFGIVRGLNLPLFRRRSYVKALKGEVGYVRPSDAGGNVLAEPAQVAAVVFPRYSATPTPRLKHLPRARSAFGLLGCALNRNQFGSDLPKIMRRAVGAAKCYALDSGDLETTCRLLESRLDQQLLSSRVLPQNLRRPIAV
jgi:hypothetical protein